MRSNNALALLSKHKHLIIATIGVVAIASYMIPFGNLFAVADASYGDWKKVKDKHFKFSDFFKSKFKNFKNFEKFGIFKISDSFNTFGVGKLSIDNKVKGGDINNIAFSDGLVGGGATAVNFGSTYTIVNNNVQVCVLVTTCANSGITNTINTNIQFQYAAFGGSVGV